MGGYPGGLPYMTPNPLTENINKSYMQMTNGSVKISVNTRTSDQNKINAHQLAFIDNKEFDRPKLMSIPALNKFIVENSTMAFDGKKFTGLPGEYDDKNKILNRFSLLGAIITNESNSDDYISRGARSFVVATWGSIHLLDYWSHNTKTLNRYDKCYLIMKRVKLDKDVAFQTDLTVTRHDIPESFSRPINFDQWYWQIVPYHTRDASISSTVFTTKYENDQGVVVVDVGTYWRIGHVHEYASIGSHSLFQMRDEFSVSRDISYLHKNGKVRPMQMYLHLDDETKLI